LNRPKATGTAAETAVVRAALAAGLPATRVALKGRGDEGDVHICHGRIVVEVKAGAQAHHPSWRQIRAWQDETAAEAARVVACDMAVLVLKRRGSGDASDWFAWTTLTDWDWATAHNNNHVLHTVNGIVLPAGPVPQKDAGDPRWICMRLGDLLTALDPR
jgi:hypothetical protein